ncbi:hypothetical protein J3D46_002861 [Paenarthrobacter sp. A20]|nr:hypothetical protein [Paenarthrobacter sp. A20]
MHVRVSPVSLAPDERDDCTSFKVLLSEAARNNLPALLKTTSAGQLDDRDVLVSVDWIRSEFAGGIGLGGTTALPTCWSMRPARVG